MTDKAIDSQQALQIARSFNLAFNNAFMYGGSHQTTRESAASFYAILKTMLNTTAMLTVSAERGSVYVENHCVDKNVSVQRIIGRLTKTGVQSISVDRTATVESVQEVFYLLGALAEFPSVAAMQEYLASRQTPGVKFNYVVYQKVTVDDAVVNRDVLSETQSLLKNRQSLEAAAAMMSDPGAILRELSDIISLRSTSAAPEQSGAGNGAAHELSQAEYDTFIASQIRSLNSQLSSPEVPEPTGEPMSLSSAEMLESVYKLKENLLESIRLQKETGKLVSAQELAISEINSISYQVIVRLIKEEYRNDRNISVKRLAQIIRRMLPDIRELKYLLPQLKEGLFAEGMPPAEYLQLVKELSRELESDALVQVLMEASEEVGLSLNELIEGVKDAPEEAARLIVLAAEIRKGGVAADDQQMSAVLSDYIEKVSRALALQSPEVAKQGGGSMLRAAVTRIEREIIDRLKIQNVAASTVSEVALKLASQFADTVSALKGDWVRSNLKGVRQPNEEMILSIIEQMAEFGQEGDDVTEEIRTILLSHGYSAETIDAIVKKAQQQAAAAITHTVEIPPGLYNAKNTMFFLDREIKMHLRYNTHFSTILVSYEKIVDIRTFTLIDATPDITIQLTNQALRLLKEMQKRDMDVIGLFTVNDVSMPFMVLPMTEVTGAMYIKKRIDKDFPCHEFEVNGISVRVEPKVTVSGFNKRQTPDRIAYLKDIYQRHCQPTLQ